MYKASFFSSLSCLMKPMIAMPAGILMLKALVDDAFSSRYLFLKVVSFLLIGSRIFRSVFWEKTGNPILVNSMGKSSLGLQVFCTWELLILQVNNTTVN